MSSIPGAVHANGWLNEHPKLPALNRCSCIGQKKVGVRKGRCFISNSRLSCKSQLPEIAPATSATYGILLFAGGLYAFTKSGSKASLFGGFTGAALMASAYFLMQAPETKAIGDAVGFGSTFLFSSVFGIRLAATRKLTPSGPLLGLSICALAVFISAYLQDSL